MLDLSDLLDVPKGLVLGVLRALWWLAWDFCVETVGWSIGWATLRLLSFGRFPQAPLRGVDDASGPLRLFVEVVGLVVLGTAIWALSGGWPD